MAVTEASPIPAPPEPPEHFCTVPSEALAAVLADNAGHHDLPDDAAILCWLSLMDGDFDLFEATYGQLWNARFQAGLRTAVNLLVRCDDAAWQLACQHYSDIWRQQPPRWLTDLRQEA